MALTGTATLWKARLSNLRPDGATYWRAPAIMVFSLFSGIMISFLHNGFNMVIDGHSAGGSTEQQWIRRVETAFAFASSLLLGISTTVAYNQYLWYYLRRNTSSMASLDAMFSATNNSLRFIHVRLWHGRPILAAIAFITWTLSLAAIFTPGTLTVQSETHTRRTTIVLPDRHYSDMRFYASAMPVDDSLVYKSMSVETTRNVGRVQLANALLPLPRTLTNVTYTAAFSGPALSCSQMESTDVDKVNQALQGLTKSNFTYHGRPFSGSQIVTFGWVPQAEPNLSEVNTTFFEGLITQGDGASSSNLDYVSPDVARFYIYLNTSGLTQDSSNDGQFKKIPASRSTPPALVTCKLYNASYHAEFDVKTTGEQQVTTNTTFLNWQSTKLHASDKADASFAFSTQALMEAFGWTFTQFVYILPPSNMSATIYGTHALQMNPALLPVQSHVGPAESTEYMMKQMEDFFTNMTLGLRFADLPDTDNASMVKVNADSHFFRSDYVYEPDALIIAYTISNVISLLCVLVGIYAIYENGASFTNNFSTIVRVTNHLELEESIAEQDRSGADPLPKTLAVTVVHLGQQREQVKQEHEFPNKTISWSISEGSHLSRELTPSEDPEWRSSTLKAIGLR